MGTISEVNLIANRLLTVSGDLHSRSPKDLPCVRQQADAGCKEYSEESEIHIVERALLRAGMAPIRRSAAETALRYAMKVCIFFPEAKPT